MKSIYVMLSMLLNFATEECILKSITQNVHSSAFKFILCSSYLFQYVIIFILTWNLNSWTQTREMHVMIYIMRILAF